MHLICAFSIEFNENEIKPFNPILLIVLRVFVLLSYVMSHQGNTKRKTNHKNEWESNAFDGCSYSQNACVRRARRMQYQINNEFPVKTLTQLHKIQIPSVVRLKSSSEQSKREHKIRSKFFHSSFVVSTAEADIHSRIWCTFHPSGRIRINKQLVENTFYGCHFRISHTKKWCVVKCGPANV